MGAGAERLTDTKTGGANQKNAAPHILQALKGFVAGLRSRPGLPPSRLDAQLRQRRSATPPHGVFLAERFVE
jgi:hypothetical protein